MAIDYAALKAELEADPKNLGYQANINLGRDLAVADLMNATTGPGAETVALPTITKGQFLLGIAPVGLTLPAKSVEIQAKWDRIISLASSADIVDIGNPTVSLLLQAAVADELITPEQIAAFSTRTGSRAEVLFGVGTVVRHEDIAKALR